MPSTSPDESISVLLVEDNPGDVRLLQVAFANSEVEMDFDVVYDGHDALEVLDDAKNDARTSYPDLILLDLNLPRMDGFEVLDALRADSQFPPLPVLVLTSSKAEEDVVKCYEQSANAYLTKPEDPDEFASLARAVEEFWLGTARLPPTPT